jgi:nuclear pore complex protein Nup155
MGVLGFVAMLLVRFALANKGAVPYGWAPRILEQCHVPYVEVWDVFHEMYESQVIFSSFVIIPFNLLIRIW